MFLLYIAPSAMASARGQKVLLAKDLSHQVSTYMYSYVGVGTPPPPPPTPPQLLHIIYHFSLFSVFIILFLLHLLSMAIKM